MKGCIILIALLAAGFCGGCDARVKNDRDPLVAEAAKLLLKIESQETVTDKYQDKFASKDLSFLEKMGEEAAALADRNQNYYEAAETKIRQAIEKVQGSSELKGYAARKKVVDDLRAAYPGVKFVLKPETKLALPEDAPASPACGEKYQHLLGLTGAYWHDPVYRELMEMPADQLPAEAMIALCPLKQYNSTSLLRGDEYADPVGVIISRYGARFLPAALEFLSQPQKYGWDASVNINATRTHWFHPGVGDDMFRAAGQWPHNEAEMLFRAALEAGWNNATRYLPDQPWARSLYAEFENGPYGRPLWPNGWRN